MEELKVQLENPSATKGLGRQLGLSWLSMTAPRPILLLEGSLGAGKTSFVKGIAMALGIDEPITSPTYTLAQQYQGQAGALTHLDLYRLEQASSADELFYQEEEEAQAIGALMAVEWPERMSCLPENAWIVHLDLTDPDDPDAGRVAKIRCLKKSAPYLGQVGGQ